MTTLFPATNQPLTRLLRIRAFWCLPVRREDSQSGPTSVIGLESATWGGDLATVLSLEL
jgi:hypothetical protein